MEGDSEETIVNQCPECRQDLDVTELSPFAKIVCPYCGASVRVRTRLGQYEIKSLLGEGGMSQVFLATDLTLGREIALKVLHQDLTRDTKLTQMFEREAKLTASINHPNVVKVYTVGSDLGYFYIAMELVDATSVEHMIADKGALPESQVLSIAFDVTCGLRAAYQENLIHRDIKPGNILVTKDGTAKLVDFGLAVTQGGADDSEDLWATPFYVPPEKLVREPDTYLGDVYALGATCFHALAGKPPFDANTSSLEELIAIKSAGVDLRSAAPGASKGSVKLFEQMMAHSSKARPSSYDKILERIESCLEETGEPVTTTHSRRSKPRSFLLTAGIGAFIALVLALLYLNSEGRKTNSEQSSLFGGSGERVISAEEKLAAEKMRAGRDAMIKGDYPEARDIFADLEKNESFRQPFRAWNTFSHGLVELLLRDEPKARTTFAALSQQKGFDGEKLKPYRSFFNQMGKVLSDPLPVLRTEVTLAIDSFSCVGLLAAGLKNWEQGEFREAISFFDDFAKAEVPSSDPWIGQLKPLIRQYQADFRVFEKLPNPSKKMSLEELEEVKTRLESAAGRIRTNGRMKKLVRTRVARAEQFIGEAKAGNPSPSRKSTEWSEKELAELATLQEAVNGFSDYRSTYLFSGAVVKLESLSPTTPKGKALHGDLLDGYRQADAFIAGLARRLDLGNYEGVIRRREGVPLEAAITAATETAFTVDLGFGPTDVEVEKFAPHWLVEASLSSLRSAAISTPEPWKETFWFALACGLREESDRIAAEVGQLDPFFRETHQRLRKLDFGSP